MQPLLTDVFRNLVIKTRENNLWEKASPEQIETLVSKYLHQHYCKGDKTEAHASPRSNQPARLTPA